MDDWFWFNPARCYILKMFLALQRRLQPKPLYPFTREQLCLPSSVWVELSSRIINQIYIFWFTTAGNTQTMDEWLVHRCINARMRTWQGQRSTSSDLIQWSRFPSVCSASASVFVSSILLQLKSEVTPELLNPTWSCLISQLLLLLLLLSSPLPLWLYWQELQLNIQPASCLLRVSARDLYPNT